MVSESQIEVECYKPDKVVSDLFNFAQRSKESVDRTAGPILVIGGGGQRGAFGGGGVIALEKLGLRNAFKSLFVVSTGAPTGCYFLAGQAEVGTSIYYEENAAKDSFIDFGKEKVMDIDRVVEVFQNSSKKIDLKKLNESKTEIYFGVTNSSSGKGLLLPLNNENNIFQLIKASCAVPELFNEEVSLFAKGVQSNYVDGSVAFPMPIAESFSIQKPSSVVVFANREKYKKESVLEWLMEKYTAVIIKDSLKKKIEKGHSRFREEIRFLKKSHIRYLIFWTDGSINALTKNPYKLKLAANNFEKFVFEFIVKIKAKLDQK